MNNEIKNPTPFFLRPNIMVITPIVIMCLYGFFQLANNMMSSKRTNSVEERVSQWEAQAFMEDRCNNIGQTLMKTKTIDFEGTNLYLFMSVAENGMVCISTISELKLELIANDCGSSDRKISEWNNL